MARSSYEYTNLTAAIADGRSPLRAYLEGRFPNRSAVQKLYRAQSGPLLVPGGQAHAGTLGAAFDFAARFVLDPSYVPAVAVRAFGTSGRRFRAIVRVIERAQEAAGCRYGPVTEDLIRASWALALTTEVYRAGTLSRSPLKSLGWFGFTERRLMALVSADAMLQLKDLHSVAVTKLFPLLPTSPLMHNLGPTFDASRLCKADADLISDRELIEIKTRLGRTTSAGYRADSLPVEDVYQVLAYALFDTSNRYFIERVGVYSARYGNFARWSLSEYANLLAGTDIDIERERRTVWKLLGGK